MQFNFGTQKLQQNQLQQNQQNQLQQTQFQKKTKLTKKYSLSGFLINDLLWMRPSDGRHKYDILVKYTDPELPKTKRYDGCYQKIIKFGQKGQKDYIDPPYSLQTRDKITSRLKANIDNPLHSNFYAIHILNGQQTDPYENFRVLKNQMFK